MSPRVDQFTGCLVGQALGDALGFLVEGEPPQLCRAYVDGVLKSGRAGEGRRGPFVFGQYSDDTQLARELVQSFVAKGKLDPDDYAGRIAATFTEGRIVGRGRATEEAALRVARGVPWSRSGTPAPSAGNGSAMRAGPVGLMFHGEPGSLVRAAHVQGCITHADPRCSAGAAAVAGAVALGMRPGPVDRTAFVATLAEWCEALDAEFAEELGRLVEWLDLPEDSAAVAIGRAGLAPDFRDPWPGISPFVVGSVLWSLYAFLRSPDNYWEAICTAIAVGGDVDTTAAMTGAIAGARVGLPGVPLGLAKRLTDQGTWGFDDLVALATQLHGLRAG